MCEGLGGYGLGDSLPTYPYVIYVRDIYSHRATGQWWQGIQGYQKAKKLGCASGIAWGEGSKKYHFRRGGGECIPIENPNTETI